jgi:hypothetical protein
LADGSANNPISMPSMLSRLNIRLRAKSTCARPAGPTAVFNTGSYQALQIVANLATVRRLAVSLLRQDETITNGAKAKRMKAALGPSYLRHVLKHAHFDA